jgi:ubiquinone/menaquinone biosynthesis C-methylase UbiE
VTEQHEIYQSQAEGYDRLIAREDYLGNLLPALKSLEPLKGKIILDMGSGTGRFPRLLATEARWIVGTDISLAMLRVARSQLAGHNPGRWDLVAGDNRRMPVRADMADVVLAGWSFGHATVWYGDQWRQEIGPALDEMLRMTRPGGIAIICETLGTGVIEPAPPTTTLAAYYHFLESDRGFQRLTVSTDYRFPSVDDAAENLGFFFGDDMAARVRAHQWAVVPEWTGIWWRRKGPDLANHRTLPGTGKSSIPGR